MTRAKAVEVLNKIYHDSVVYKAMMKRTTNKVVDDVDDTMIALLTAIDALKQSSTVEAEHNSG